MSIEQDLLKRVQMLNEHTSQLNEYVWDDAYNAYQQKRAFDAGVAQDPKLTGWQSWPIINKVTDPIARYRQGFQAADDIKQTQDPEVLTNKAKKTAGDVWDSTKYGASQAWKGAKEVMPDWLGQGVEDTADFLKRGYEQDKAWIKGEPQPVYPKPGTTPPAAGTQPTPKPGTTPPAAGTPPPANTGTTPPTAGTQPTPKPGTTPPANKQAPAQKTPADPQVAKWQRFLNERGAEIAEDGIYGPETQGAYDAWLAQKETAARGASINQLVQQTGDTMRQHGATPQDVPSGVNYADYERSAQQAASAARPAANAVAPQAKTYTETYKVSAVPGRPLREATYYNKVQQQTVVPIDPLTELANLVGKINC